MFHRQTTARHDKIRPWVLNKGLRHGVCHEPTFLREVPPVVLQDHEIPLANSSALPAGIKSESTPRCSSEAKRQSVRIAVYRRNNLAKVGRIRADLWRRDKRARITDIFHRAQPTVETALGPNPTNPIEPIRKIVTALAVWRA